jgi:hypothetical protein
MEYAIYFATSDCALMFKKFNAVYVSTHTLFAAEYTTIESNGAGYNVFSNFNLPFRNLTLTFGRS